MRLMPASLSRQQLQKGKRTAELLSVNFFSDKNPKQTQLSKDTGQSSYKNQLIRGRIKNSFLLSSLKENLFGQ